MTRYVCSWCGRKQEGVNISSCGSCTGPLDHADLLADQQKAVRDRLRKALLTPLDEQPPAMCTTPIRKPAPPLKRLPPPKRTPPIPRKPKPLVLRSPPPSGLAPE